MPVRAMNLHRAARRQVGQIGEVVGEESALHAIDAQVEAIAIGRRGNRISPRLLLALRIAGHRGDKLSRYERKALQFIYDEVEVVTLGDFRNTDLAFKTRQIKLAFQSGLRGQTK